MQLSGPNGRGLDHFPATDQGSVAGIVSRSMTTREIRRSIPAPAGPMTGASRCRDHPDATNPGDSGGGATPVPIPNTEVKPSSAEDTERAAFRENRSSPGFLRFLRPATLGIVAFGEAPGAKLRLAADTDVIALGEAILAAGGAR